MLLENVQHQRLQQSRNKFVAKSFYKELQTQGFSPEQIIQLSTTLLGLVTEDLKEGEPVS